MNKILLSLGLTMVTFSSFAGTATSGSTSTSSNSGVTGNNVTFTSPSAIQQNIDYSGSQTLKNVPSVNGPPLTTSNDTCMGSTSGSLNVAGLGFGGGSTWTDVNCKRLKNARELWNMGMKAASLALLCKDDDNREALEETGFKCPPTKKEREMKSVQESQPQGVKRVIWPTEVEKP